MSHVSPLESITVRGRRYAVRERLSVLRRGRWRVHHPAPRPRGTTFTAIILPASAEADQLRKSVAQIPPTQSSLPKLVDWETVQNQTTILVSWCEGLSLAEHYKRFRVDGRSPVSVWESVRRAKAMAYGLADLHLHARVIHADIKPANLILPSDPGSLFLIDFGSGWQIERTSSRRAGDGWNASYSSPEVFQELDAVDARADQFSLGVVLFEMLTGKLPYDGYGGKAGHRGMETIARTYQPPSHSLGTAKVPSSILREIDDVVGIALKLNPEERFGNSRQVAQAL
ncbi:MAG: protein kinase, partial [Aureliella sp.]